MKSLRTVLSIWFRADSATNSDSEQRSGCRARTWAPSSSQPLSLQNQPDRGLNNSKPPQTKERFIVILEHANVVTSHSLLPSLPRHKTKMELFTQFLNLSQFFFHDLFSPGNLKKTKQNPDIIGKPASSGNMNMNNKNKNIFSFWKQNSVVQSPLLENPIKPNRWL